MRKSSSLIGLALLAASLFCAARLPAADTAFVDLEPRANRKLTSNLTSDDSTNSLIALKPGEQTLGGIKFKIGPRYIQLGSKSVDNFPDKVEGIPVNRNFTKLHVLHATAFGRDAEVADGTQIGHYLLHYDDGALAEIPIVYGEDVRDWWFNDKDLPTGRSKIAWKGDNAQATGSNAHVRLYMSTWANPKPNNKVLKIDYVGRNGETVAAPFCVSISVE